MSLKRYLAVSWGLGMLAIVGCAASHVAPGRQAAEPQRSYPNASDPIVVVARYHTLEAGGQIAKILDERGTPSATIAGSEEGVVMVEASRAAKIRAIIAEAIGREHLDATITDK